MAQRDAQKSEIHEATDDATESPSHLDRSGSDRGNTGGRTDPDARGAGSGALGEDRVPTGGGRAASPPSNFERGGADRDADYSRDTAANPDDAPGQIGGGPGAGDASSGGGAGSGIPGGGTDMRTNGAFAGGDVDEDRRKLFPETDVQVGQSGAGDASDQKAEPVDPGPITPDESDYGGPIRVRTDLDLGDNATGAANQ